MIGRPKGSGVTPLLIRFLEKIRPRSNGCWEWTASVQRSPWGVYGQIWNGIRREGAHRVAYKLFRGELLPGFVPDHFLCGNTLCVNPWHLEAVPHRINTLRGTAPPALNVHKLQCPQGHPYSPENTYHYRGARQCVTCRNSYRQRKRLEIAS